MSKKEKKQPDKYVLPFCNYCGAKTAETIVPIEVFEVEVETLTSYYLDENDMPRQRFNKIPTITQNSIFDSLTGERLYKKYVYCPKKCDYVLVDRGTYKQIIENKKIRAVGSWPIHSLLQ